MFKSSDVITHVGNLLKHLGRLKTKSSQEEDVIKIEFNIREGVLSLL